MRAIRTLITALVAVALAFANVNAPAAAAGLTSRGATTVGTCYASGASGMLVPCALQGNAWQRLMMPGDDAAFNSVTASTLKGDGSAGVVLTPTGGAVARTLADLFGDFVNVRAKGARGDARITSPVATIAAGSTALSTATAQFAATDVGKTIILGNAGTGPATGPVMTVALGSGGAGYTAAPSCALTDASGSGSGATCAAHMALQAATLASAGSGCAADGTYEFLVGIDAAPTAANPGTPAKVTGSVVSGALTGTLTVTTPGLLPALGTVSGASLYGGNCSTPPTANLSYAVGALQATAQGAAYSPSQTTATLSGSFPTTAAAAGSVVAGTPVAQPLVTTITAYLSPTQVTLAAPAVTNLSGAAVQMLVATDDQPAIQAAITAATATGGSGGIWMPAGTYWIGSLLNPGNGSLTVRGDGPTASTLVWDSGQSVAQNAAGWTPAFGNTGVSRAQMRGRLRFEGFAFRGTLDFGRINRGAMGLELNFYREVSFDRMLFTQAPNMAMALEGIDFYSVTSSVFDTVMRDQARCRSCFNAIIRANQFRHSDDDSVALHQASYIQGAGNVRESLIVEDNTFEDTTCIHILGARSAVIRGNILRRCKVNGISVAGDANEGPNQIRNLTITDNIIADLLARPPFIGGTAAPISIVVNPPSVEKTGNNRFMVGSSVQGTTYFGKPWNYDLNSVTSGAALGPVARGVVVRGNQYTRTLAATPSYAAWGFGKAFSNVGYVDVPVPDTALIPTAGISASINILGLKIADNVVQDVRRGISLNDNAVAANLATISITGNQIYNAWEYGIVGLGTGNVSILDITGNQINVDPYGISPGRGGGHGGWTAGYAASNCLSIGYTAPAALRGNTLSDCYSTGLDKDATWRVSDNVVRGLWYSQTTGQLTAHSTANYGIAVYPTMAGNRVYMHNIAADPTASSSTSQGVQNSARAPAFAAAAPTSGSAVIGDITWSSAPGTCACLGWQRLTTGTGWTAGTDYKLIPLQ